ncbi:hypothetical protein ATE49_15460 [Elizabethkingia miricola]|uniref:DUF551 domain-containing protein n=1 Tax=Elizabethkingia miricola TaxID=172045 RepID=A0ABY3NAG6_ELIMR|nr:hypothetical protein [Elizabethkingia miricola]OBS12794.1 hypothetical protein ATE49_15460 [Elizabethkingia miricola]TYO83948.1 hypothetical protein LX74_04039 [Elizabethkingia miricola]
MKRLEEIKNEVAKEHDYNCYNDMIDHFEIPEYMVDKVAKRYAREVAQASLERVKKELVKSCKDVLPTTYRTGNWDGKNSDVVIAISKSGKYHVAFFNDGFMDGEKFECWYDENEYLIEEEITHWMEPDYFKESITNESNITLL